MKDSPKKDEAKAPVAQPPSPLPRMPLPPPFYFPLNPPRPLPAAFPNNPMFNFPQQQHPHHLNTSSSSQSPNRSKGFQWINVSTSSFSKDSAELTGDGDGRKKRRRTTVEQSAALEAAFLSNPMPSSDVRDQLAKEINLPPRTVQVWFQNRRQTARKKNEILPISPQRKKNRSATGTTGSGTTSTTPVSSPLRKKSHQVKSPSTTPRKRIPGVGGVSGEDEISDEVSDSLIGSEIGDEVLEDEYYDEEMDVRSANNNASRENFNSSLPLPPKSPKNSAILKRSLSEPLDKSPTRMKRRRATDSIPTEDPKNPFISTTSSQSDGIGDDDDDFPVTAAEGERNAALALLGLSNM